MDEDAVVFPGFGGGVAEEFDAEGVGLLVIGYVHGGCLLEFVQGICVEGGGGGVGSMVICFPKQVWNWNSNNFQCAISKINTQFKILQETQSQQTVNPACFRKIMHQCNTVKCALSHCCCFLD